jgi:hypothetical protein
MINDWLECMACNQVLCLDHTLVGKLINTSDLGLKMNDGIYILCPDCCNKFKSHTVEPFTCVKEVV